MRKLLVIALLSCCVLQAVEDLKTEKTSQSFLFTRPVFNNTPAHVSFWHDSWFDLDKQNAYQMGTQYQTSFSSDKMKRYFLMEDRDKLIIRGTSQTDFAKVDTDVCANWLDSTTADATANPLTSLQGTLVIKPEQWQACWTISARRSLPKLADLTFFDRMWVFIDVPIVTMRNNLNLAQESVTGAAASTLAVNDIVTAFNNTDWKYQKIKTGSQSSTKIGQVKLGFGKTFISKGSTHLSTYSAISIPTCGKQTNEYLFQPQAGFNGHVGISWGANLQVPLTRETDDNDTCLYLEIDSTYLIRNHQFRTFDLRDKEWSRFLNMRLKDQTTDSLTPGVNVLTKRVRVSPYALIDVAGGMRFNVGPAQAEFGVGVWGHNKERIKLTAPWKENYGIAGLSTNTSASNSTIKTYPGVTTGLVNDTTGFVTIKETDIDFDSGASLGTVIFRGHAAIGARGRGTKANGLCGAGMFVEIPRNKTKGFKQWGIWIKVGGAF